MIVYDVHCALHGSYSIALFTDMNWKKTVMMRYIISELPTRSLAEISYIRTAEILKNVLKSLKWF